MILHCPNIQVVSLVFRQLGWFSVHRASRLTLISGVLLAALRPCLAQKPSGEEAGPCAGLSDNEKVHCQGVFDQVDEVQKAEDDADAAALPVLSRLSPNQRLAYQQLRAAFQRFLTVQVTGDFMYLGAYGSTGLAPQWETAEFARSIAAVNTPSKLTSPDYGAADRNLNAIYRKLRAGWYAPPGSASPKNGLIPEEKAWILYRDAWPRFGRTLHPEIPSTYWLQWITEQRTQDLQKVYALVPLTASQ